MNNPRNTPTRTPDSSAQPGGQHEGLRHPVDDDRRVEQRLDEADLDDQGEATEDQLRDRRSSGAQRGAQTDDKSKPPRH